MAPVAKPRNLVFSRMLLTLITDNGWTKTSESATLSGSLSTAVIVGVLYNGDSREGIQKGEALYHSCSHRGCDGLGGCLGKR